MEHFYKVVSCVDNKLYSVCQHEDFPEKFRVNYLVKEWVEPVAKGSRLFVFKGLSNAKLFTRLFLTTEISIYSCEVEDAKEVVFGELLNMWWVKRYLENLSVGADYSLQAKYPMYDIPEGSYSGTKVKLIEKVS